MSEGSPVMPSGAVPPIRVVADGSRWVVDYGDGVTRRFVDREEALAVAREAAEAESRELDVAA